MAPVSFYGPAITNRSKQSPHQRARQCHSFYDAPLALPRPESTKHRIKQEPVRGETGNTAGADVEADASGSSTRSGGGSPAKEHSVPSFLEAAASPAASSSSSAPPGPVSFSIPRVHTGAAWVPRLPPHPCLEETCLEAESTPKGPSVHSSSDADAGSASETPKGVLDDDSDHGGSTDHGSTDHGSTDPPPPFYTEPPEHDPRSPAKSLADWSVQAQKLRQQVFSHGSSSWSVEDFRDLAAQAADIYARYVPVVLCDLRDVTFWFRNPTEKGPNGEMVFPMSENGAQLFAPDAFFEALAEETSKRMPEIHPINVVYLLWTFTRKFGAKNIEAVYRSASPHLCAHLEELDRCGIGMVPWCYAKSNVFDEHLMEECAHDLCRRAVLDIDHHSQCAVNQLAPRNVQNTCWSYARVFHRRPRPAYLERLFHEMGRITYKLLQHDPKNGPKTPETLCNGYTTETGRDVPPDSFRLMSLGLIGQSYRDVGIAVPLELQQAMEQYALKGLALSPFECDKYFLMDSYDIVLATRTLTLTPALAQALKRVAGRHLSRLKPRDKEELRVLGLIAIQN